MGSEVNEFIENFVSQVMQPCVLFTVDGCISAVQHAALCDECFGFTPTNFQTDGIQLIESHSDTSGSRIKTHEGD
jgi:uncharacterized protein YukJ